MCNNQQVGSKSVSHKPIIHSSRKRRAEIVPALAHERLHRLQQHKADGLGSGHNAIYLKSAKINHQKLTLVACLRDRDFGSIPARVVRSKSLCKFSSRWRQRQLHVTHCSTQRDATSSVRQQQKTTWGSERTSRTHSQAREGA